MHPPHRPKRNESGEKSVSILVKTFFFFFFFFFGDHRIWAKKTFEFPISAEKSLSILVKTSEFLRFCASNFPPPKFSGSATGSAPRPPKQPPHREFLATHLVQVRLVVCDKVMGKLVACKILLLLTFGLNNSYLHDYNNSSPSQVCWPVLQ